MYIKAKFLTGKTRSESSSDISYETLWENFCQNTLNSHGAGYFGALKVWAGTQDTWTQFLALSQSHCAAIGEKKIVFFVPHFPLFLTNSNKIIAFLPQSSNFVYLDGKQLGGNNHVQARNTRRF